MLFTYIEQFATVILMFKEHSSLNGCGYKLIQINNNFINAQKN